MYGKSEQKYLPDLSVTEIWELVGRLTGSSCASKRELPLECCEGRSNHHEVSLATEAVLAGVPDITQLRIIFGRVHSSSQWIVWSVREELLSTSQSDTPSNARPVYHRNLL